MEGTIVLGNSEYVLRAFADSEQEEAILGTIDVSRCEETARRYGLTIDDTLSETEIAACETEVALEEKRREKRRRKLASMIAGTVSDRIIGQNQNEAKVKSVICLEDGFADGGASIVRALKALQPELIVNRAPSGCDYDVVMLGR